MIIKDFSQFIKEGNFLTVAFAFVLGAASNSLVKSFVDNIFMAFVNPLTGATPWQEAILSFGPIDLKYGAFLADFLHFLIIAFIIFIITKKLFKIKTIKK